MSLMCLSIDCKRPFVWWNPYIRIPCAKYSEKHWKAGYIAFMLSSLSFTHLISSTGLPEVHGKHTHPRRHPKNHWTSVLSHSHLVASIFYMTLCLDSSSTIMIKKTLGEECQTSLRYLLEVILERPCKKRGERNLMMLQDYLTTCWKAKTHTPLIDVFIQYLEKSKIVTTTFNPRPWAECDNRHRVCMSGWELWHCPLNSHQPFYNPKVCKLNYKNRCWWLMTGVRNLTQAWGGMWPSRSLYQALGTLPVWCSG